MKLIATVLSCAALLSCSGQGDASKSPVVGEMLSCPTLLFCNSQGNVPKSPLLGEMVRAPDVVWATDTFDCRQIAIEDTRLDALSKANAIERHGVVRDRNIYLIEWVIPYYGWVATARAGMLEDEIKHIDLVILDAADRRQELKQFALTKGCVTATAEIVGSLTEAPAIAPSTVAPKGPDASPAVHAANPMPRLAPLAAAAPARQPPAARAPAAHPTEIIAPTPPFSQADSASRADGNSVILPLGPGADVDRAAAEISAALQQPR
jgi:hypothetical protein